MKTLVRLNVLDRFGFEADLTGLGRKLGRMARTEMKARGLCYPCQPVRQSDDLIKIAPSASKRPAVMRRPARSVI